VKTSLAAAVKAIFDSTWCTAVAGCDNPFILNDDGANNTPETVGSFFNNLCQVEKIFVPFRPALSLRFELFHD
jgi:hypothetical protein